MRQQDKAAYEKQKTELASKFGFEPAKPKDEESKSKASPVMVNSSSGNDSDDEKAALVKRIQAMTADEEEDPFDKPIAFGSQEAQ